MLELQHSIQPEMDELIAYWRPFYTIQSSRSKPYPVRPQSNDRDVTAAKMEDVDTAAKSKDADTAAL